MVTARRVGRWALYGVGACVGLLLLARVGLAIYLATPAGRAMVARQIEQQIGLPVEVTSVRVGLFTSSIGMRVFDPVAPEPSKAEVFAVDSASADVSLFGLAVGRVAPKWVELHGVNLTLHVAADGKVVTTLPRAPERGGGGELPAVKLTGGRITVRQDGRPEFALHNLDLAVEPASGGAVKLSGSVDDPAWSKWTISGEIDRASKTGWVELATDDGPLTMDPLASLPFVPPEVWEQVRPDGRGAVSLRAWTTPAGTTEYSVDIRPHAASLTLPEASVTLGRLTGLIRVSGATVELTGARAELAGGSVTADGAFDFGADPTAVNLKISGEGLDIRRLPTEWKLPKDIEGQLKGHAELSLMIYGDGHIDPDGGGEGKITEVKVLGFPADDIPIHLHRRGHRYEFDQPKAGATGRGHTRQPVRCAAPRQEKKPAEQSKKEKPPPTPDDAPTTLDATIRLREIEISELLAKLNVKLGYKISGKITVEAALAVPVGSAMSLAAYQFSGSVTSPALHFEGLTVREFSAKMTYGNGKLTLADLSGKIDQPAGAAEQPGVFRGTATAAVDPPADATASLTLERIPLGEVLKAIPDFKLDLRGTVAGKVSLKAPYEKLWDTTLWSGSGELTSSEVVAEGRSAKDIRVAGEVAKGSLALKKAGMTLEGIPVTAEGTFGLADKFAFSAAVRTTGTDVTDLRKLLPELEIPAPVEGVLATETKVTGTLTPLSFTASGTITASKLTLARSTANHVAVKWELTRDRLAVPELKADAFGGTLTGSADVPFDRDKAGKFDVAFKDVDAAGATELIPDFPVRIAGKVSGRVGGTIPPAKPGEPRVGNLDVDITAPKLTVQGIPAERLVGKGAIRGKSFEYQLEGKTLGGSFEVKGRYPGQKKGAPGGMGMNDRGSFRLTGLDLSRIATDVGYRSLAPLRGRLDANFEFENDLSEGSGRVTVTRLQWGDAVIANELSGPLLLRDGLVELPEVTGRVAGGELRVRARARLRDTSRNFFSVALNGADAKQLLAPISGARGLLDGPVTVVVRGRVGTETHASGTLTLPRGSASGVQVSDLRVPFEFSTSPGGHGRFTVREAAVHAGSGRLRADLTADWGLETRVEGKIRFADVPLRAISPAIGESSLFGNGRITGRFDLGGRNVRSPDDLTGTLVATLNNTSVKEIPVLDQTTRFLNPSGLVKPFQAGDLRATLANGTFHVRRLALANPAAQLFAEGTISTDGRVDLDVVAHTGAIGPDVRALRLFGLRIPAIGPIPIGLIRDVSDFLSNRTIRMSVTGTTRNPIVRVNVGALLTEQAVRFFLSRYIVPAEAAAALGYGASIGTGSMSNR